MKTSSRNPQDLPGKPRQLAVRVLALGFSQTFFTALCHNSNLENSPGIAVPRLTQPDCAALIEAAPPMKGLE
jgi:hypothetical protein